MTESDQPPSQPGPIPEPPQYEEASQYAAPPGYPPPNAYGYGYGYPQPPKSGTNGLAIAAMICGICGFACIVPGVVGIILGFVSLPQIKRSGQSGRGMAITGIVLGSLWIVALILLIVIGHTVSGSVSTGNSGVSN